MYHTKKWLSKKIIGRQINYKVLKIIVTVQRFRVQR